MEKHPGGPIPFDIKGGGNQTRAFVHIDDFTDGLMAVIEKGAQLGIYHIGNPEEVTIADVARKIAAHFGREVIFTNAETFAGETVRRCPDITKLRGLGYEPRIPLDKGLASIIEWYKANQHRRDDRLAVNS
jgi:dTDP-glucose 4,6-dehydratase/UDP-glucose 4-epimerase